jgi:hypothetical protein
MRRCQGCATGVKNEHAGGFITNGELGEKFVPMLQGTLAEAYALSSGLKECGTFVFKNIMTVFAYQPPETAIAKELTDFASQETWCGAVTNGTDLVAAVLDKETVFQ